MQTLGRFRDGHRLALSAANELCLVDDAGQACVIDRRCPVAIEGGTCTVPVLSDGRASAAVAPHAEAAWLAHHLRLQVRWGGHAVAGRDLAPLVGAAADADAFEVAAGAGQQTLRDLLSRWQAVDTGGRGARLSM